MLLSIITVNYNNVVGLQRTIESIVEQDFRDFEYIVIDGGSTDGSVDIIKKNEKTVGYWISEPDYGIYNAMNKGIAKANGEFLLMINSGDYLVNKKVLKEFFSHQHTGDIIYGDIIWDDKGQKYEQQFPDKLSFNFFRYNAIGHQAAFVRKSVHQRVGMYDEYYRITSDWKFFLSAICKYNISYQHVPLNIAICGRDGISCLPENWNIIIAERKDIFEKDFTAYLPDYTRMDEIERELTILNKRFLNRLQSKINRLFKRDRKL